MTTAHNLDRLAEQVTAIVAEWYEVERGRRRFAIGKANGGLHVIELFRATFPLRDEDIASRGASQLRGISGASGDRIIRRFEPDARSIGTEAGRTSRGTLPSVRLLAERLNAVEEIGRLEVEDRGFLADVMQRWIVENVILPYQRQLKLEPELDPRMSLVANVAAILDAARERDQGGPVAQHLVGAKLALRFPQIEVENHSATTADMQTNRPGDFVIGDTVFHVTMTPAPLLLTKCADNLRNGFRVIVLVPSNRREMATGFAEDAGIGKQVEVYGIEPYVGQNVGEIAEYRQGQIEIDLRRLLEKYNERVAAVEPDQSLQIEIPRNLSTS